MESIAKQGHKIGFQKEVENCPGHSLRHELFTHFPNPNFTQRFEKS